jgi:murein L,D-transpeptidase YcbB/YkuD
MPRLTLPAARTTLAAVLALAAASSVRAQTPADSPSPNATASPSASASTPPAPGSATPPPADAPAASAASADTAAAPPVDPLVAQVRDRAAALRGNVIAADLDAVKAFYAARTATVWVTTAGFTARARHAMAEIAKADDWGLEARAFDLPKLEAGEGSLPVLADAEIKLALAVLKYARYARGGRLVPAQVSRNFDMKPPLREPDAVMEAVASTETPGDYLRGLHPRHPQFELLRQALLKARAGTDRPEEKKEPVVRLPAGPVLKLGVKHPHVALLRQRLKIAPQPGEEDVFDAAVQEAVMVYQRNSRLPADGMVGSGTRAALNGVDAPRPAYGSLVQRLVVNMERWRWMPEDLGTFYVWDNIPEFQSRVVKAGRTIYQTKIIVGKPETQTAVFSANMRYVVFGPEWGVPDSIKVKEILPYLRPSMEGGFFGWGPVTDTRILERHNLRVSYNGQPVDASQVDWSQVDIRRYTFIQPSGPTNVLGGIKFRFPNKHDIYMHDTPQRELFGKTVRAYSHGCIRVQNPGRLAEILLEEDKGWSAAHVRNLLERGGNNEVTLAKQIPVHITYFTVMVGDDGQLQSFGDLYGHDHRVAVALAGRPLPLESPSVTSTPPAREARRPRPYRQTNSADFFSGLFGN